jgi:FkbM family methyltransferase
MRLNVAQKLQTAFSAFRHKAELKNLLIRRFWQQQKILEVNVQGTCAKFDTSDFLSNVFFWQSEFSNDYEPAVSQILGTLIQRSKVYADIGGNVGFFSIIPALLNAGCKVFYFEMDRTIRPLLIRNMLLNHLNGERITIVNAAVGDRDGEIEYLPHPYSFLAKLGNEDIDIYDLKYSAPQITLDSYFLKQGVDPDLLKIDIDGAEMFALRGMSRILADNRPDLLLEVHPAYLPQFGSSASEVSDFLKERGYRFFRIPDFRNTRTSRLLETPNFENLASPTGDMLLVTTGLGHKIADGVLEV